MANYSGNRAKKNIFISYRVSDTAGETGRLVDSLKQYFYEDQIFMDIEKLEPGVDFTLAIARSLECCDVLLAVIGPNWHGKNPDGTSRIMNHNDWVRLELATALKRNVRVVPVLVDGGKLPSEDELPPELAPLVNRQAHEITNKRWKYDTDQLVIFLKNVIGIPLKPKIPGRERPGTKTPWTLITVIGGGVVFLLILLLMMSGNRKDTSGGGNVIPVVYPRNIQGTWIDSKNQYYLIINQNDDQLDIGSFSMAGQNTGQGTGSVKGDQVIFKIAVTNVGVIAFNAAINDNATIIGTISVNLDGKLESEPVTLVKSPNATN